MQAVVCRIGKPCLGSYTIDLDARFNYNYYKLTQVFLEYLDTKALTDE